MSSAQIPGGAYVDEVRPAAQAQIPGSVFLNETLQPFQPPPLPPYYLDE